MSTFVNLAVQAIDRACFRTLPIYANLANPDQSSYNHSCTFAKRERLLSTGSDMWLFSEPAHREQALGRRNGDSARAATGGHPDEAR